MALVLVLSSRDNVAVALDELGPGDTAVWAGGEVVVAEVVPAAHKVAIAAIETGRPVVKYGAAIGIATASIQAGAHVHTHNVESDRMRGDR